MWDKLFPTRKPSWTATYVVIAFFCVLIGYVLAAHADPAPATCTDLQQTLEGASGQSLPTRTYTGADVLSILKGFDMEEGTTFATDDMGASVTAFALVDAPNQTAAFFFYDKGGCGLMWTGPMGIDEFEAILKDGGLAPFGKPAV